MQYYKIQNGTLFEDFESVNDWTLSGTGCSIAVDTTNIKSGAQSLKVTSVNNVSAYITKTINQNFNNVNNFAIWLYIDDITKYSQANTSFIILSSTTDFSKSMTASINLVNGVNTLFGFKNGWNKILLSKSDFTAAGGEVWTNDMIRLRFRILSKANETVNVSLDSLYINEYSRPKCILSFDDGRDTTYTEAYSYMRSKGMKGVSFMPMSPTRLGQAGYMTLAQVAEIYNYGWDVSGHSYTHIDLTGLSLADARIELQNEIDALNANGFTRAAYDMSWPFSAINTDLVALCQQMGLRTARTGKNHVQSHQYNNPLEISRWEITNTQVLADYVTVIKDAIASGGLLYFNLHNIITPADDSVEMTPADFKALIDYLASVSQLIDVVTLSEWYKGLTEPRKAV